jgi:hypothetical protein
MRRCQTGCSWTLAHVVRELLSEAHTYEKVDSVSDSEESELRETEFEVTEGRHVKDYRCFV